MEDNAQVAADVRGWDAIDDHRTGTAGDRQTSDWLMAQARDAGGVVRREDFRLSRWILKRCTLRRGDDLVEGVPLFDGGTTGAQGVGGRLSLLTDGEVASGSAAIGLGSFGHAAGAANRALAEARNSDSYRAVVAVSNMDSVVSGLALQNADRFRTPFGPPVLQVATEYGPGLHEAAVRGETVTVTAHVGFETATGSNVVCRLPGREPGLLPLVVLTPKSAWWVCTAERGGGIAVWLALLRHLAANRPRRDVLFVATSGHELGHLGLDHFLTANDPPNARAWIHLGANFAAVDSRIRLQASDADLLGMARNELTGADVSVATTTPLGERPGGEARNVHDLGARYVSLLGSNAWFHHPEDRWPVTVDLDRTRRIIGAGRAIVDRLN